MVVSKADAIGRLKTKVTKWGGNLQNVLTDYATGAATVKIEKEKNVYSFSYSDRNQTEALSKLSWSVCRLIDCDIRGILPFKKTANAYLQIQGEVRNEDFVDADEKHFEELELTSGASNFEVMRKFKQLVKDFHPDNAPEDAWQEFEQKMSKINVAYAEIKKARGF